MSRMNSLASLLFHLLNVLGALLAAGGLADFFFWGHDIDRARWLLIAGMVAASLSVVARRLMSSAIRPAATVEAGARLQSTPSMLWVYIGLGTCIAVAALAMTSDIFSSAAAFWGGAIVLLTIGAKVVYDRRRSLNKVQMLVIALAACLALGGLFEFVASTGTAV